MRIRIAAIVLSSLVIFAGVISGQTTSGSITGNIIDQQQAAIAGATVTITEEGKSFSLTTTTDEEGRFVFAIVPPGTYKMTIEAAGFKKQERVGVNLVSNDRVALGNVAMEVGSPNEVVNVTSEAT
ncbi:MAG TPA: carboxypeptidase-like regulatory domain-containing protein, partial [Pyrinomonadaceae bacterium]|nr:carboxypeptidase-like regulatory domain-containing protein [Pyrinomonadaceae bacterium]